LFEPLWNRNHIEKVHICLLEKIGVETRGDTYDGIGALKDVGQNHMLQMLALIGMEPPKSFDAENIRKERAQVLGKLQPITSKTVSAQVVRGQYDGFRQEQGVREHSQTETYFRIESYINNTRW